MKPLKYTEFKFKQALFIQQQDYIRTNYGVNTEQFCIDLYKHYLIIIGYKNESVFEAISIYRSQITTFYLNKKRFNQEIADNIEAIMDNLNIEL